MILNCNGKVRAEFPENKGNLRDFESGMVVSHRWAGLSISETADLQPTTISRDYRQWSDKISREK